MQDMRIALPNPAHAGPRFPVLAADDHQQIMAIIAAYGRFYDDDRISDFMDLFVENAVFFPNWPGVAPDKVVGREALEPFFAGARAICYDQQVQPRHYATNVIITEADGDNAAVTVAMLYAESRQGGACEVKMVGQYDYVLTKIDNRWSISQWSMRYDK